MSLATSDSDDPVVTVVELLDGTSAADWPGTKPTHIEKQWESDQRTKGNRSGPAAYVWSPADGTRDQLGAEYDTVVQTETVGIDVWTLDDERSDGVAGDVVAILEEYATDNRENTEWVTIRPTQIDDRRAETIARRTDHHVVSVSVELMRDDATGT